MSMMLFFVFFYLNVFAYKKIVVIDHYFQSFSASRLICHVKFIVQKFLI